LSDISSQKVISGQWSVVSFFLETPLYEEHFGLRSRPFGDPAGPAEHVGLPSRDSIRRRLRYGLEHGQGPAVLSGPSGTGKTVLVRGLVAELGWRSAHLTFPAMPAADLIESLADEIAAPRLDDSPGLAGSIRRLRVALAALARRGDRFLLVVDEAHLIDDPAAFEALRLLLNFATLGPPDLALLLVGGSELPTLLPPSLADRLTARCRIAPLTLSESAAYVAGRLAIAGASRPLFDPLALAELHRVAEGLPRRLDRVADLSLLVAFAQGAIQAEVRSVLVAASEANVDPLAA
jgi:type II secretory pathway predicted ATPase ExeA